MRRETLEMLVAKVADVTRLDRLVIVGSQSAHGQISCCLGRGWEDRLVPIMNSEGRPSWWALEIHDTAASKLMAGRDKDFDFIIELAHSQTFGFETFLSRATLLLESSHAAGLRPRVQKLAERLRVAKLHDLERAVLEFLKKLPT